MKKALLLALVAIFAFTAMPLFAQGTAPAATSIAAPAAPDAGVGKLTYGPGKWIAVHLLLQAQYQNTNTWDTAAGEDDSDGVWASSFKIRRARLIVSGQVAPNIDFFVETDDYNRGGRNQDGATTGTRTDGTFIQDAYVNFKVAPELQIACGMILLPFMHHNRQSAASLLGVDYNTDVIQFPNDNVWRDTGVEFRGLLFGGILDYRIGLFQGVSRNAKGTETEDDDINPNGVPRITGRMQVNLMDAEDGFFYCGNYLGKKKIVSFGGGIDWMADRTYYTADNEVKDYFAWTVDVTIDYPIAPNMVLAFQGAYVQINNSPDNYSALGFTGVTTSTMLPDSQYGYFAQVGLLINDFIQPVVKYASFVYEDETLGDITISYLTLGCNFMLNGHNANIKIEYRHPLGEAEDLNVDQIDLPNQQVFTIQTQVFI
jgi:hypothetical protein